MLPNDTYHFLANWDWTTGPNALPKPFSGNGSVPVTYLGIDEARAYCKSVGKRLPREEEWQFAGTGRNSTWGYPWGEVNNASLYPKQVSGYTLPGATPVGTFSPEGDSGFGVGDLLGNVWQVSRAGDCNCSCVLLELLRRILRNTRRCCCRIYFLRRFECHASYVAIVFCHAGFAHSIGIRARRQQLPAIR